MRKYFKKGELIAPMVSYTDEKMSKKYYTRGDNLVNRKADCVEAQQQN